MNIGDSGLHLALIIIIQQAVIYTCTIQCTGQWILRQQQRVALVTAGSAQMIVKLIDWQLLDRQTKTAGTREGRPTGRCPATQLATWVGWREGGQRARIWSKYLSNLLRGSFSRHGRRSISAPVGGLLAFNTHNIARCTSVRRSQLTEHYSARQLQIEFPQRNPSHPHSTHAYTRQWMMDGPNVASRIA